MPSVLAIQSHVVHGFVGNKAATFPLQMRGWNVDALNTVQFSNHTGYGSFKGTRTSAEEIETIYEGIKALNFEYEALLTGYVPSAAGVEAVGKCGVDLKTRFPKAIWLLDPVMGDEGKLYVAEEVIPAYKHILKTGKVDMITPNGFEVETLTGISLSSFDDVKKALSVLHNEYNVPNVIVSSVNVNGDLYTVGSTLNGRQFRVKVDKIDGYFSGTGDLFSALTLDNYYKQIYGSETGAKAEDILASTVAATLKTLQTVLIGTNEHSKKVLGGKGTRGDPKTMRHVELRLIEHRKDLETSDFSLNRVESL